MNELLPDLRERLVVTLEVVIRPCRRSDLEDLEWFGMFTPHREIIHGAYEAQERGENLMLVAEANRFPVGQAWIDLARKRDESVGLLWAVRVMPPLRRLGIGRRLLRTAERALREQGFRYAEIGVEKENPDARRLYERSGYRVVAELHEEYEFTPPGAEAAVRVPVEQWMLRKRVDVPGGEAG